jgi:hypothetical protein
MPDAWPTRGVEHGPTPLHKMFTNPVVFPAARAKVARENQPGPGPERRFRANGLPTATRNRGRFRKDNCLVGVAPSDNGHPAQRPFRGAFRRCGDCGHLRRRRGQLSRASGRFRRPGGSCSIRQRARWAKTGVPAIGSAAILAWTSACGSDRSCPWSVLFPSSDQAEPTLEEIRRISNAGFGSNAVQRPREPAHLLHSRGVSRGAFRIR